MKAMGFIEYAERLDNNGEFQELIDEMYWGDCYNAMTLFKHTLFLAEKNSIEIKDKDTVDYEDFFWNVWGHTEKGLS